MTPRFLLFAAQSTCFAGIAYAVAVAWAVS